MIIPFLDGPLIIKTLELSVKHRDDFKYSNR